MNNLSIMVNGTDIDVIKGIQHTVSRRGEAIVLVGAFGEMYTVLRLDDRRPPSRDAHGLSNARPKLIVPKEASKMPFHVLTAGDRHDHGALVHFVVPREGNVAVATTGKDVPNIIGKGTNGKGANREFLVDMPPGAEVFVRHGHNHYIFSATVDGVEWRKV